MKIHNPLDNILNNEIKVKILRQLFKTNEESSGRQIAGEIGVSPAACHKVLQELYEQKVLKFKNLGNTHLYSLNNKNIIVETIIKPVFERESQLPDTIGKLIISGLNREVKKKIVAIALFGSMAKKNEKSSSDIDLLVLVRNKRDIIETENNIYKIGEKILKNYGNTLSPYILELKEFKKKYHNRLPLILNILSAYKLVTGKALERLV